MSWRVLSVLAFVLGSAVLGPAPAGAVPSVPAEVSPTPAASTTWALQPAADGGPDGRISLRHVIEGGAAASDLLALTNFSGRPATFAVYASDGVVAADGSFDVLPSVEEPAEGGAWITIGAVEGATPRDGGGILLEVAAGAAVLLPVDIAVPAGATPGDHPAGIVAELVQGEGGAVQLSSRVGVRVHLRVAGDVVAALVPEVVTASYEPSWNPFAAGTVTVTTTVANAGNVRVGARTAATLAGPGGVAPAAAESIQREVLPSAAATTTVEIPVAPLLFAWGDVVVTPVVVGEDDLDGTALSAGTASFTVWTVPWSQLVLVLALVGAWRLVRSARRRSAARVQARIDAAVAAATAAGPADGANEPRREGAATGH